MYLLNGLPSYGDGAWGGVPVVGSASQREGEKVWEEWKMVSLWWRMYFDIDIAVPAGMR